VEHARPRACSEDRRAGLGMTLFMLGALAKLTPGTLLVLDYVNSAVDCFVVFCEGEIICGKEFCCVCRDCSVTIATVDMTIIVSVQDCYLRFSRHVAEGHVVEYD